MSFRTFILLLFVILCWNCAQQGSPSGGPKDEDPPVVLDSEPPNYSTRFNARKILITFDEFIVLDNVNQELVVSPPMEEKPEVRLRKKTLVIQFEEELKENTTYTFNFGSSIKDLHEGNKLLNYEYVFSTGDVLDSLSVRGTLKYAEDLKVTEEPVYIMLYDNLKDSIPLIDIPLYVGRSDDSGMFSVNNLRADTFKIFALKDGNYNFLFDLPTEEIGFLDSSLIVNAEFARSLLEASGKKDSIYRDTIALPEFSNFVIADPLSGPADTASLESDSATLEGPDYNSIYIDLLLFTEENETQYITDATREERRFIQIFFARALTDSFHYQFFTTEAGGPVEILEVLSAGNDSLTLWLMDSTDYKQDTLTLEVNYTVKDTAQQYVTQTDTLIFAYRDKKTKQKKKDTEEEETLTISTIRENGQQHLNSSLKMDFPVPLEAFHDSLIGLFHIQDSVEIPAPFRTRADTLVPTRGWIDVDWESISQYRLQMLPGAVTSIYDLEHDTVDVTFRTRDIESYGQILLTLKNVHNQVIIQLISKDKLIRTRTADDNGLFTFSYLVPQDYVIKFIHDLNGNGKWDTGNYLKKLQPEPVEFISKEITVRANWDHDVTMLLEK